MVSLTEVLVVGAVIVALLLYVRSISTKVYRFYRPGCPHCVESQAEWDSFKMACLLKTISPIDVNMDTASVEEKALYESFKLTGVPSIVKLKKDGTKDTYNGNRKADDIMAWATK